MTSRRWRVSARGSADQPLAALNQLQPTYVRCPKASRAGSQTACLIKAVAEYLAVLPSRDARVIASARSGKLCVLDLRLDQKIDGASGCLHSCMHCARLRVIPWKLACTACCTARLYNLVWTLSGLWPKAELGSTHGIGLGVFYSVSRMER
jgi:hypothetical protein